MFSSEPLGVLSLPQFPPGFFSDPDGRPGMSDVSLLSGISGLPFDSLFLSPLLFFPLSSRFCSFCLVIFLLMVHSPAFFSPENFQIFFVKG